MQVRSRTKNVLILRDSPVGLWTVGTALLFTGAYLLFELARLRVSEAPPGPAAALTLLAGGVIGVVTGLSFLLGVGATTYTFDKKGDRLVVQGRGLFARSGWGCTLANIESAVLESILGLDGSPLYRVALITATGRHIPLTPLYVSDRGQHQRILLSIRQFLAKEGQRWWVNTVPEAEVDVESWRRVTMFLAGSAVGLFVVALGCAVAMIAAHAELLRFLPMSATVLSTRVETRVEPDGRTVRRPVISSRYVLRDRVFVTDVAPAFDPKRDDEWTLKLVNSLKPGERYTAYYDPDHPHKLLLSKPTLTTWYIIATLPVILLLIVAVSLRTWMRRPPDEPSVQQSSGDGLVLIMP
jgi:hypothetical protein